MSKVDQKERKTQQRVVKLFRDTLGYAYLGNREERDNYRNIEAELVRAFLKQKAGYDDALITRALHQLDSAFNTQLSTLILFTSLNTQHSTLNLFKQQLPCRRFLLV